MDEIFLLINQVRAAGESIGSNSGAKQTSRGHSVSLLFHHHCAGCKGGLQQHDRPQQLKTTRPKSSLTRFTTKVRLHHANDHCKNVNADLIEASFEVQTDPIPFPSPSIFSLAHPLSPDRCDRSKRGVSVGESPVSGRSQLRLPRAPAPMLASSQTSALEGRPPGRWAEAETEARVPARGLADSESHVSASRFERRVAGDTERWSWARDAGVPRVLAVRVA